MNHNVGFGSKARRLTRRLSYGISKVLKDWNNDSNEAQTVSAVLSDEERNSRIFNIEELVAETHFTKSEIQFIYRDFKMKCPNGILTEKNLVDIYSQVFSCGDTTVFAKHLFSALVHQRQAVASGRMSNIFLIGRVADPVTEVNFKDFLIALSRVIRGNQDEKIKWLFNFYDANRDGRITIDEISSLVRCMYDLMGTNVNPPVDDAVINGHIEYVTEKLGLEEKPDKTMSYTEFHRLFSGNPELAVMLENVSE